VGTVVDAALLNAVLVVPLALLAAVGARLVRRPAVAHALWLLVLLKLLTPPLLSVPIPWADEEAPAVVALPPDRVEPLPPDEPASADAEPPELVTPDLPVSTLAWPPWQTVVGVLWLTGSVSWLLLAGRRLYQFRRWLGHTSSADAELQHRTRRLAGVIGLTRCPSVWTTSAPLSPMVWALFGPPRLLLPSGLWGRLDEDQRDALLLHELAHLRRGDHLVRWLELFALGLYWWHPVAWWARRELREAEEQCCDAWAVWALPEAAPAYAAALVEAAAFLSAARSPLPAVASGIGHVRCLKRRLTMILRANPPRSLSWTGLVVLFVLGVVLLPLGVSGADRPPAKPVAADEPPDDFLNQVRARGEVEREQADAMLAEFNTLYKLGRYAEAEKVAQNIVKLAPDDPRAQAALALSRAMQRPAPPPARVADDEPARREQLERARDEVELLEAQLAAKRAACEAAMASLARSKERVKVAEREAANGPGKKSAIIEAVKEVDLQTAQIRIREAELLEPEVRLKQAMRRFQALEQATAPKSKAPAPAADDDRLREVERKLEQLLREVERLRRPTPRKESNRGGTDPEAVAINIRKFQIPIAIDPDRSAQIRELLLFVSDDRGASWRQAASATPTDKHFSFRAPGDGEYWFNLCTVNKEGVRDPQTPQGHPPANKVIVDTVPPAITLRVARRGADLEVMWTVQDKNPGTRPVKLTYTARAEPTETITVPVTAEGETSGREGQVVFRPAKAGTLLLRLTAEDRAGNSGFAEAEVPAE
jgi:bla regulator protein blaR1